MNVAMFTGVRGELPHSMRIYRDGVLGRLTAEHPDIHFHEQTINAWPLRIGSGVVNRYLRYFPRAIGKHCGVAHILDQNNAALALALPGDVFIVQTVHDFHSSFHTGLNSFFLYIQGLGVRRADRIVTPSVHTATDLVKTLNIHTAKIVISPNGLDPKRFHFDSIGITDADDNFERPVILHVGSEVRRKNISVVLEVFQRLRREFPRAVLIRVGEPIANTKKRIAALGLQHCVVYQSNCSDARLARLYRQADLFLFPSNYEGFGLPVLEAMAAGCPVVASNAASLPEVGGEAVLYASPGDVRGFVDAARAVLMNAELRKRLIPAGIARAEKFSWSTHVDALVAIYKQGRVRSRQIGFHHARF